MRREGTRGPECPICHNRIAKSAPLFRNGNRCEQCGSLLLVSASYGRGLWAFTCLIGLFLVWIAGIRDIIFFPLLWAASWLPIFIVALRFAPFVVPPRLVKSIPQYTSRRLALDPINKTATISAHEAAAAQWISSLHGSDSGSRRRGLSSAQFCCQGDSAIVRWRLLVTGPARLERVRLLSAFRPSECVSRIEVSRARANRPPRMTP
jgi:hypothetical protein